MLYPKPIEVGDRFISNNGQLEVVVVELWDGGRVRCRYLDGHPTTVGFLESELRSWFKPKEITDD